MGYNMNLIALSFDKNSDHRKNYIVVKNTYFCFAYILQLVQKQNSTESLKTKWCNFKL